MVSTYHGRITCFAYKFKKGKEAVRSHHKELLIWALRICPMRLRGKRALDIGCAYGYTIELLREMGCECIGIDLSSSAIRVANELKLRMDLEVVMGDAERLPFRGNRFDIVTSFELIEHLSFPEHFVGEVWRILKKGGIFILTTPIRGSLRQFYDILGERTHISLFKPEELISMLRDFSFRICDLARFTILPIPPHLLGRYLKLWKIPFDLFSTNMAIVAEKV